MKNPNHKLSQKLQENFNTKNPYLDLGNLRLKGTEPELEALADFMHLETLILSNMWSEYDFNTNQWIEKISENDFSWNVIKHIPALPRSLKTLIMNANWNNQLQSQDFECQNYEVLASFAALQTLDLRGHEIEDLSVLQHLTTLENLYIDSSALQDISFLYSLRKLKHLVLHTYVQDYAPIAHLHKLRVGSFSGAIYPSLASLKELTHLSLSNFYYEGPNDLAFLHGLPSLTALSIEGEYNPVDISDLKNLPSLKSLGLDAGRLDISGFDAIPTYFPLLEYLSLKSSEITAGDIKHLSNLQNLKSLYLCNYTESVFQVPSGLTKLETLDLRWNSNIQNISFPNPLPPLKELYLSKSPLQDFHFLKSFSELKELGLHQVKDEDLQCVSHLHKLETLAIEYGQIENLESLASLINLKKLTIEYNPIKSLEPLKSLTRLEELKISFGKIEDILPLVTLTNLKNLDLSWNQIENISPLTSLIHLTYLTLYDNPVKDWSVLDSLLKLENKSSVR